MQLTHWFDRSITPLHIGVYEVRRKPNGKQLVRWFAYWTGKHWACTPPTVDEAFAARESPSYEAPRIGGFEWRGIRRKKFSSRQIPS
ncbi:hypothetical protein [Burkholderia ubonensis]|uniref:hypothetical protein n=1 Tax=Burkholderia ubonensis TaxID=101571 RepID=UPI000A5A95E3|nr:hypothetical protein [Burkholderia ubonensis]